MGVAEVAFFAMPIGLALFGFLASRYGADSRTFERSQPLGSGGPPEPCRRPVTRQTYRPSSRTAARAMASAVSDGWAPPPRRVSATGAAARL